MLNIYVSYKCKNCGREFVLLIEDIQKQKKLNRYLVCPYCSSRRVDREKVSDNVKECMKSRSYKRKKGSLVEVK